MSDPEAVAAQEYATWQGAADNYANNISPLTALAGQLDILAELGKITDRDQVLELGCGPGDVAIQLASISAGVTGIDFSENMIEIARGRFTNLAFEVADAEKLPFEDDSFDVVVSNFTAHHFARPQVVFEEARRVLRENGRLAVVMPIQSEQMSFAAVMSAIFEEISPEESPGGPLLNATEPGELTALIEAAGFRNVEGEKRLKPTELTSAAPLLGAGWDFMGLHDKPQDMQDRIRAQTLKNVEAYRDADGILRFPDRVLLASASA
jgi:SAM-dependent methyltransferase